MIYLTGEDVTLIVLETGNLERLKTGQPCVSPDKKVLIAWTPDVVWLADKLMDVKNGDAQEIARLIEESAKRPEKPKNRPHHEPYLHSFLPQE